MELVLRARGARLTERERRTTSEKLAKLGRVVPRAVRLEVEVISERNPRLDGTKRLEGTLDIPRHTFRAKSSGADLDEALDHLVRRLERQIRDHRARRKKRLLGAGNRLKSPRIGPEGTLPGS